MCACMYVYVYYLDADLATEANYFDFGLDKASIGNVSHDIWEYIE